MLRRGMKVLESHTTVSIYVVKKGKSINDDNNKTKQDQPRFDFWMLCWISHDFSEPSNSNSYQIIIIFKNKKRKNRKWGSDKKVPYSQKHVVPEMFRSNCAFLRLGKIIMLFVVFTIKRKNTIIQNKTSDTTGKVGRSLIKNFSSNRRFRLLRFVIRFFSFQQKKQVKK